MAETKNKYAIVTGSNKGIGFEICRQLASQGITVVLTARDEKRGLEALEKLKCFGLSDFVMFNQLDVSDQASIASFVQFIQSHIGKLDILILPSIKAKWPEWLGKTIYIQQENARPHINDYDSDFRAHADPDGFQISLVQQPPNNPDVNVNDLGFFRAIQSLQQQHACKDASELVNAVITSFNTLEHMTLNKVFLSLQSCLVEILKVKGCNSYKLPHMKKDALILLNQLPRNLELPMKLVKDSLSYLIEEGQTNGIEKLIEDLGMQIGS